MCRIVQGISGGISVTGGICQIYSPVFVWDDVITRVYHPIRTTVDLSYRFFGSSVVGPLYQCGYQFGNNCPDWLDAFFTLG